MPSRHPATNPTACSRNCPGCPECSLEHQEYAPKPTGWLVVAHLADGQRVTRFASKSAAKLAGEATRRAGIDAFVYRATDAKRFGAIREAA